MTGRKEVSKTFVFRGMEYSKREYVVDRTDISDCGHVIRNIVDWCESRGVDLDLAVLEWNPYETYIKYVRRATPQEIKAYDAAVAQGKEAAKKRKESVTRQELSTLAKLAAKYGKTLK